MLVSSGGVARANIPSHVDGLIAFQRNADASGQIWVIDPAAPSPEATAVKVTTGPEPEAQPAWGPTNGPGLGAAQWQLAAQRLTGGSWDIWNRTTRGTAGEQRQFDAAVALVSGAGDQTEPAYSRALDGTQPHPSGAGHEGRTRRSRQHRERRRQRRRQRRIEWP